MSIARQIERRIRCFYVSGAGLANCTRACWISPLTLSEVVLLAGFIAKAVKIPAIVDADTGFGGGENAALMFAVRSAAGLAGCHLEDQEFPKRWGHLAGKSLIASADMEENQGCCQRKRDQFLVIARTDARASNFAGGCARGFAPRALMRFFRGAAIEGGIPSGIRQAIDVRYWRT